MSVSSHRPLSTAPNHPHNTPPPPNHPWQPNSLYRWSKIHQLHLRQMKNRSRIKTIPVHLTTLIPLGPWYPVDTFGPLLVPWEDFVPLWPTLDLPVPFGPLLVALCPYGTLGAHVGIFLGTFGPLCAPLIQFGHLWATFGSHGPPWVTFEPIWYSCGPLWATLGPSVPLGTFGFIGIAFWSLWAPLCYLWPPLVYLEAMWSPLGHY